MISAAQRVKSGGECDADDKGRIAFDYPEINYDWAGHDKAV
jgi:hypothetical protein